MKIAHISDIHWRNLKFHKDYRRVFENLLAKLDEIQPDLIVNTGDTAHTKTNISPEYVQACSWMLRELAARAPVHNILGNHDLNLMNLDRQDAMTPVVESIGDPNIKLFKQSGHVASGQFDCGYVRWWVFGLADQENYPTPADFAEYKDADTIDIGLYHGSVRGCVTDSNFRMRLTEADLSMFEGLDFVLMGDIHKQQSFNNGRAWYAGSLIQQNFGEEVDKGFLLWDIKSKNDFTVTPFNLEGSRKFVTVRLRDDLTFATETVPKDCRLRVVPPRQISFVQQKAIERDAKKRFKPHDVIVLSPANVGQQVVREGAARGIRVESLRSLDVQERLLREYMRRSKTPDTIAERVVEMNRRYQLTLDKDDDSARDVQWKLQRFGWSNMFNYGQGNIVDFGAIRGLTGLFAPNASGKSALIDILLTSLFDGNTKGVNRNVALINDNRELAAMVVDFTVGEQKFVIERTIERVKEGQRSGAIREWGKTVTNFWEELPNGVKENLNGDLRPETERAIRRRVGNYEDFLLTALSAQWNPLDLIACKETERKRILYKFLDLDPFENKCKLARDESKKPFDKLRELEAIGLEEQAETHKGSLAVLRAETEELETALRDWNAKIADTEVTLSALHSNRKHVDCDVVLADVEAQLSRAEREIDAQASKVEEKRRALETILAEIKELKPDEDYDEAAGEAAQLRLRELADELAEVAAHKKAALESLKLAKEVECPKCNHKVDVGGSRKKASNRIEALNTTWNSLQAERAVVEHVGTQHDKYLAAQVCRKELFQKRDNLRLQLRNAELKLEAVGAEKVAATASIDAYRRAEEQLETNKALEKHITYQELEKERLQNSASILAEQIKDVTLKIGSEQGLLGRVEEQIASLRELRDTCTAYEKYIEAMGKDGISLEILTQKLPLINEEINKILSNAADFGVYIEHDQEEQSVRLYIQYGHGSQTYKSRFLELGSGAEKMLASVAMRTALLSISSLPKTNMLVIDEGLDRLDPKNMEAIGRMFDYLRTVFEHVLVISHVDVMKDMVDNIIDITADDDGYAHVEVT